MLRGEAVPPVLMREMNNDDDVDQQQLSNCENRDREADEAILFGCDKQTPEKRKNQARNKRTENKRAASQTKDAPQKKTDLKSKKLPSKIDSTQLGFVETYRKVEESST